MRTSQSQFQILVEYMERKGDLSKPTEGPQGRANNMRHWVELSAILNADSTGDTKTVEKWRKVWSDYKNNTKKKAARIYRSAQGTGGGPALNLKLTDLEERLLRIVGTQAATGIVDIPEVGLEEEVIAQPPLADSPCLSRQLLEQESCSTAEDWNQPGPSTHTPLFPEVHIFAPVVRTPLRPMLEDTGAPHQTETSETGLMDGGVPPAPRTPLLPSTLPHSSVRHASQSPTPLPPTPRRPKESPSAGFNIIART